MRYNVPEYLWEFASQKRSFSYVRKITMQHANIKIVVYSHTIWFSLKMAAPELENRRNNISNSESDEGVCFKSIGYPMHRAH